MCYFFFFLEGVAVLVFFAGFFFAIVFTSFTGQEGISN
jgi:hypothetical protein